MSFDESALVSLRCYLAALSFPFLGNKFYSSALCLDTSNLKLAESTPSQVPCRSAAPCQSQRHFSLVTPPTHVCSKASEWSNKSGPCKSQGKVTGNMLHLPEDGVG